MSTAIVGGNAHPYFKRRDVSLL